MAVSNAGYDRNIRGVRTLGLLSRTLVITDAQFKALPFTPGLSIVPPPGVGKYLVPVTCVVEKNWPDDYGNITDDGLSASDSRVMVGWTTDPLTTAFRFIPIRVLELGTTKRVAFSLPFDGSPFVDTLVDKAAYAVDFPFDGSVDRLENRGWNVFAANAGGDFSLGGPDNTLTVTAWYLIRTFGYPL